METIKNAKEIINQDIEETPPVEFITSGSTMLNLALSQKGKTGGWARGRIVNVVGDGSSGKTLISLELAARFYYGMQGNKSYNFPDVKKVQVIYNNVESVMDFPVQEMYGDDFYNNIEWINLPFIEKTGRDFSNRVFNLKKGESLLYIIDSWDALKTEGNYEAFQESAKKDTKKKDGYNLDKQKYGTQEFFPSICTAMDKKDVTLVIVSQVRDKINAMFGAQKIRTGGKALDFFTHQVGWLRQVEKLKRVISKQDVIYGVKVEVNVKRNKVALPYRKAMFTILFNYGIDDISSMLDWYFGPKTKPAVKALDFFSIPFKGDPDGFVNRNDLIDFIEKNNLEEELQDEVEKKWKQIEKKAQPNRKKKF